MSDYSRQNGIPEDLDAFADSLLDALLLADEQGRITYCNRVAANMFGYAPREMAGQPLTILMPQRYRAAHDAGLNRVATTGVSRVIGRSIELEAVRKDGSEFPIELSLSSWRSAHGIVFSGVIRDLSERRRSDQREKMQYAVTRVIAESQSILEATTRIIETIGYSMDWDAGAMWILDPRISMLRCTQFWSSEPGIRQDFQSPLAALHLRRGEGLPGSIWDSGEALCIADVSATPGFPRAELFARHALRSVVGFPIADSRGHVSGVVELMSRRAEPCEPMLIEMLVHIGRQIGMLLERVEGSDAARGIIEQMHVGILVSRLEDVGDDHSLRVISVNPAACRILRVTHDAAVAGLMLDQVFPALRLKGIPEVLQRVVVSARPVEISDFTIDHESGSEPVALRVFPLPANHVGVALEMAGAEKSAERLLAAEERARESEGRFYGFMNSAPFVAYIKDEESRYVWVNPAFEKIFHITNAELRGRTDHHIFSQVSAERNILNDRNALANDAPTEASSTTVSVDGREHTWFAIKFPLRLPSGERHIGGVAIDITARTALEKQLERVDRVSSLGRVAANVAHEMNNVLMGIAPFAEVIARRTDDPKVKNAAAAITRSVERGRRITSDVLGFTRAAEPSMQPIACRKWLHELEPELRSICGSEMTIVIDAPDATLTMFGDPLQLQQVVANLALNARDATDRRGRLVITCRRCLSAETFPFVSPPLLDRFVSITFEDDGKGIPPDLIDHIFEPLFTTKRAGGTGLGLAIVSQVIAAHGGEIHVRSLPGGGTTFYLFIPASTVS